MLTRLTIKNYRSLEDVDLPLGPVTALVGPNGSGKTSILRALSCLFGDVWPSLRSFRIPYDFWCFDTSLPIEITGWFDPPYVHRDSAGKDHKVYALRVTCTTYKRSGSWGEAGDLHVNLDPLDEKGEAPYVAINQPRRGEKLPFRPLAATGELRDHARILFVDHRRSLSQHLPSVRGSILGRLLGDARRVFNKQQQFKELYEAALAILRTEQITKIENKISETAKRMLGFLGQETSRDLHIGFGFADPANPFNSLRLEYRESGLGIPGDELGLGIQSALVVGIFEAFRQLGAGHQTIVIEEPEMYLHPQAQRYFYKLLRTIAEEQSCQVIYSTHSPIFADVNAFETLRLVRRKPGHPSSLEYIDADAFCTLKEDRDKEKLSGRFDSTRNEILFASRTLLVEGHADRIAALIVAEKMGLDVDAEGIAIVNCGGKNSIPLLAGVCKCLSIPFVVLHDEDIWDIEKEGDQLKLVEENRNAAKENKRIAEAVGTAGKCYVAKPTLEALLGIGKSARDKPLKVASILQDMDIRDIPASLKDAVRSVSELGA
jgi:putative ATP-dependent endonuclease of OLD family